MKISTKQLVTLAMLSAIAFAMVALIRIPVVLFLKYDPKDIIIAIAGFLYGPLSAFLVSLVVSLIEMVTISDTGLIGLLMNVLSTCAFACTAAWIYRKNHSLKGALIGLGVGSVAMIVVMLLWNYLITPIYMGYPREAVAALLLPAFLPFNALKAVLNAAFTFLLYKPLSAALKATGLLEKDRAAAAQKPVGLWIVAALVIVTGILLILVFQGKL